MPTSEQSLDRESGVNRILSSQRLFFQSGQTKSAYFRREQLAKLETVIQTNEALITKALHADLGKSEFESFTGEIGFLLKEIHFIQKNLAKWMKPEKVKTPIHLKPAT